MEKRQKGRGSGEAGGGKTIQALVVQCVIFFFFLEREKRMLLICLHCRTP